MAVTPAPVVPSRLLVAIGDGELPLGDFDLPVRAIAVMVDVDELLSSRPIQLQLDRAALRASLASVLRDAAVAVEAMADEDLPGV